MTHNDAIKIVNYGKYASMGILIECESGTKHPLYPNIENFHIPSGFYVLHNNKLFVSDDTATLIEMLMKEEV